jgi:hypothetical protein
VIIKKINAKSGVYKMIIDARQSSNPNRFRPFSVKAAVSDFLDGIEAGSSADVDALINASGKPVPASRLSAYVTLLKEDRAFQVDTKYSNAGLATVRRIA